MSAITIRYYDTEYETPAYKIFHELIDCRVPAKALVTEEQLTRFGRTTTGDREMDEYLFNRPTNVMLPLVKIMAIALEGYSVSFLNQDDYKRAHDWIAEHLFIWRTWAQQRNFTKMPPEDDLWQMEEFLKILKRLLDNQYHEPQKAPPLPSWISHGIDPFSSWAKPPMMINNTAGLEPLPALDQLKGRLY